MCRPVLQILTLFQTKNVIFYTRFQTRPLKSMPVFRPGLYAEIILPLLRLRANKKFLQIHFEFAYFFFFLAHLELETTNTFIHSVVPSKPILGSRPEWAKCQPVFRPKRRKNPTRWGGTYLRTLRKGVSPPGAMDSLLLARLKITPDRASFHT